jgi:segregation and condensation protein A
MTQVPVAIPSLDGYQLRLPAFEGPLDVLLRLIERDQLPVSEISLLAVFDQFMAYVAALDSPELVIVAEFVAIAGRLSVLKSRSLLPRPPITQEDADEIDLVRQLAEYRAVKTAAELLAIRQRTGSGAFGRGESVASPPAEHFRFTSQPPSALAKAVSRWLTRLPAPPVALSPQRVVTLREMISRITSALDRDQPISFDRIRATCVGRQETAVAFLAILTLLRRHTIHAIQPELFGAITLTRATTAFGTQVDVWPQGSENVHDDGETRA